MFTSCLTTELLHWAAEARSYASIARTYAPVPGFASCALEAARECRAAIARMAQLLTAAVRRTE